MEANTILTPQPGTCCDVVHQLKRGRRRSHQRGDFREGRLHHWAGLDLLEQRILLSGDNVFAQFIGSIAAPGGTVVIPIELTSPEFTLSGGSTRLGFLVSADNGGTLDPRNPRSCPVHS